MCRTFPGSLYREGEFPDFTLINLAKSEFSQLLDPSADKLNQELIAGLGSHFPGPAASLCPFTFTSLPATHIPWDFLWLLTLTQPLAPSPQVGLAQPVVSPLSGGQTGGARPVVWSPRVLAAL